MKYSLKRIIWIAVILKLSILVLIALGHFFLPFNLANYQINFNYPAGEIPNFWTAFKTWDGQHYLFLADKGYSAGQMSNAFYPLLPLLLWIVGIFFMGDISVGGIVLSNGLALLAIAYLYRLTAKLHGPKIAFLSSLLLLAFPTGFYSGLIYSESLFLVLATSLFYFLNQKKAVPAAICAFLLPLTRPTGILVLLPALFYLFAGKKRDGFLETRKLVVPLAFMGGFVLYLGLMKAFTGDAFAGFAAQGMFALNNSAANLLHPLDWFLRNFIQVDLSFNDPRTSLLNRACFLGVLAVLWVSRKSLSNPLWVYSLALGIIPALSGDLVSYIRFASVLFPLFLFLAVKLGEKAKYYAVAGLVLQGLLVLAHSLNYWVA